MVCENCGSQVSEDAKFCPNCGRPQQKPTAEDDPKATKAKAEPAKSSWPAVFALAAVLVLAIALGGAWYYNGQTTLSHERAAAATAIGAVGRLDAVLGAGTDFNAYVTRFQAAEVAVASYSPSDAAGMKVKAALVKAMIYYTAGRDAWNSDAQGAWSVDETKPAFWSGLYPDLDMAVMGPYISPDDIRGTSRDAAAKGYAAAMQAAAAYAK
jgi:hypothetical protein